MLGYMQKDSIACVVREYQEGFAGHLKNGNRSWTIFTSNKDLESEDKTYDSQEAFDSDEIANPAELIERYIRRTGAKCHKVRGVWFLDELGKGKK